MLLESIYTPINNYNIFFIKIKERILMFTGIDTLIKLATVGVISMLGVFCFGVYTLIKWIF